MSRGVSRPLFGSIVIVALIALAGCGHYFYSGEREPWRHEAEVACLNSGAVKETPGRVRIAAIEGPGICGMDFPLRVSALGDSAPLGYDDEPLLPPGSVPDAALPQHWPLVQSRALPPLPPSPSPYGAWQSSPPPSGPPLSLTPDGVPPPAMSPPSPAYPAVPAGQRGVGVLAPDMPHPYPGAANSAPDDLPLPYPPPYPPPPQAPPIGAAQSVPAAPAPPFGSDRATPARYPPPLGRDEMPGVTAAGPVEIKPPATLACPIVSALDQWIGKAVQPAALKWFRRPVVEIKQISAYSCRGMNGNPNAHISEHAFGNALDIAEFDLADGHRISVQYGWRGTPQEQGFLHDVQLAACEEFSTVLAPGANVYHYNHIHVDLMRRYNRRRICEPAAIPGEVVAERARARYAAQHLGDPAVTGSIRGKAHGRGLSYSGEDDDRLPLAVPGED